jgi:hypothetical protein
LKELPADRHIGLQELSDCTEATTPSITNMMCLSAGIEEPCNTTDPFDTFNISNGKSRATLSGINLH